MPDREKVVQLYNNGKLMKCYYIIVKKEAPFLFPSENHKRN